MRTAQTPGSLMRSGSRSIIGVIAALMLVAPANAADRFTESDRKGRQRVFDLTYEVTLKDVPAGKTRVWIPVPQSSTDQDVKVLETDCDQSFRTTHDARYGNEILYFESTNRNPGNLKFSRTYRITRHEIVDGGSSSNERQLDADEAQKFLSANKLVPITGRPIELLEGLELSDTARAKARALYDRVDEHVAYDKSQPGYGRGDSSWVCDSRTGNCTDFHSLFISLARSEKIPARFEIGFPLPTERGEGVIAGYHCWAMFHESGRGWMPVDISEADKHPELKDYYFGSLSENRVRFSQGRDIQLVPTQAGPPLNYFVYPYVELDGKVLDREKINLRVTYSDKPGKP